MASDRCCACNGPRAICKSCSCVKSGLLVLPCHPGGRGCCRNGFTPPDAPSCSASPSPCGPAVPASSPPSSDASPDAPSSSLLPSLDAICRLKVPLLTHVPKNVSNNWSGILLAAIESVTARPSDLEAWTKLFMLPKCTLFIPPLRSRRRQRDLANIVKQRFSTWRNGDHLLLWEEASS